MPPTTPPPLRHQDKPWFSLFHRWAVVLFLGLMACVASLDVQASTVGTTVTMRSVPGSNWVTSIPVGSGAEYNDGGLAVDIVPGASTSTITITWTEPDPSFREWTPPKIAFDFSGGTLDQITSVTRTGGTASDAGSYAPTASGKTITIDTPASDPVALGTIIFTFTSTTIHDPTVTGLSATSGPEAGGTPVTITGTNFTGATAVKFGSNNGTNVTVVNDTSITATAPAGTGVVDVTVTNPYGTSATSANSKFTYVPAATYTVTYYGNGNTGGSVPTDGSSPYSGGSTVTVLGNTGSLTRSGYTFNGWNTAANGSGTNYDPDSTFTISGNTEFYARWQLIAAPVANAVSATVAANSSNNAITLNITGGTPTSVAVASGAGQGTATASGTSITYTPNSGYSGNDSFTYTATNVGGTSVPATVSITVNPQAPVANAVSATVAYNSSANPITLNITGGTPASVAVASGASHGTATASGTSISYTPTNGYSGNDSFTYTATNAGGTSAPATVTITVNPQAPVANAVSATVAANSSANPITLNITGGTPTSVAVASGASHGTATASGTSISYTPTNGYSGSDSFTYTATNAGGTSAPATVTITVNAAVPGAPTIGTATAGDQQASVTFTAPTETGGAPITGYEVTVQPGGTKVSGTASPITVPGLTNGQAYTFTVAAKNSAGTGAASSPSNSVTPKMGQTITFAQPASQRLDATPTLAATATSGLAVTFSADAATLAVCEITSGGTLAFHTAGACTIHADQAGDGQYLAAPRVSRTFNVQTAAPGAPTNVVATPGDTQARVAFTPPVDAGTSPITGYTVTVQPGGATVAGTASPIVVPGLTNGVAYTFTVTATNAAGTGAASSPSNSVTPKGVVQGTVPTPTSGTGTTGTATASTAALSPAQDPNCRLAGAQFAGEVPPGFTVSYGSFEFLATDCQHGVTISLTYPQALPQGVRFMKFGPPSFGAPEEWMDWTSQVQLSADRKTATYSVLDNGAGDSDPRVGLIADPIIPAGLTAPGPSPEAAKSIPTLGEWALALLAALLGLLGWRQGRARAA